jgi:hypothetical protein
MKLIKHILFGPRCQAHPPIKDGFHTILPKKQISFNDWCKELKVSSRVPRNYEKSRLY